MKYKNTGIIDFNELSKSCVDYIDNTSMIKDIVNSIEKVYFILKGEGEGKSVDTSMLKYFFDIKINSKNLFENLNISNYNEIYTNKANNYPVIFISFGNLIENKFSQMLYSIKNIFMNLYIENYNLLDEYVLYKGERKQFDNIISLKPNEYELKTSILLLIKLLKRHYNKNVILIIDDYDVPIYTSIENNFENDAISLFKDIYRYTIKDNVNLEKVIVTGKKKIMEDIYIK